MTRSRLAVGLALILAGCGRESPPAPAAAATPPVPFFVDVTDQSGIDMTITSGVHPATQILEVKGGGLALVDMDGDGDLDLFVPNGATLDAPDAGPGARLFANRGDGTFDDVTTAAGITLRRWGMGVAPADYDDDGDVDLYVSCFGPDVLLANRGDGTFEDVTATAGIAVDRWSTGCAWGDLDGDGDLDLYVTRYVDFDVANPPAPSTFRGAPVLAGPRGLPATDDVLLENLGDGTFRDVSDASGIRNVEPSYGLGVVIADLDQDGTLDIFVGNDSRPNFLFRHAGDPGELRFEDVGARSGLATSGDGSSRATMGITLADVDGDGRPDVFTTNFAGEPNALHVARPGGFFDDATARFGLGMPSRRYVGWGAAFADLDHDGDEDLVLVNGHTYPQATDETMFSSHRQVPLLFERTDAGFTRVEPLDDDDWLARPTVGRTIVLGDLDGDGDLDAVAGGVNEPVRVLRNDRADGHWLIVAPERPLGCVVTVTAGERVVRRWIASGTGFMSAGPPEAHVGLGTRAGDVSLRVEWPDGHVAQHDGVAPDQRLVIVREGSSP